MILEAVDIHSGYGETEIIRGVTLKIKENEMTCIIGPNGAGKSTLLKTLFGILKARQGAIYFKGENITDLKPTERLRRGMVYCPQGRNVFPMLSVEENLELGAYIRNDDKIKEDIEIIYQKYPLLKDRRRQMAGSLSGGEQQILQLARSLLLHPKLLLLDEPSAGLSPKVAASIFREVEAIREDGVTIVIVEQNAKKALSMSDHALVLELGVKRFEGSGKEILNNEKVRKLYLGG